MGDNATKFRSMCSIVYILNDSEVSESELSPCFHNEAVTASFETVPNCAGLT